MLPAEVLRYVREEIQRQLNIVLSGQAGANDGQTETIDNLYPGMASIEKRPVMHPAGFASRAARGTIAVTARQGASPENRMVLGHRDSHRPTDLAEGEACIYASDGHTILSRLTMSSGTATLKNDVGDFIAAVVDCLTDIGNATTVTQLGSQPLVMPDYPTKLQIATSFKKG